MNAGTDRVVVQIFVLTGEDYAALAARRDELLRAHKSSSPPEFFDAATDVSAFLSAVRSPALFGPARLLVLDNAHELSASDVDALADAASPAVVVATAAKWLARHRKLDASVEVFKKPDERALPGYLRAYARQRDVQLSPPVLRLLAHACRDNPEWARQVVSVCELLHVRQPSPDQVERLLAGRHSPPRPFEVRRDLSNDPSRGLAAAWECEPFSLVAHLRNHLLDLAAYVHDPSMLAERGLSQARLAQLDEQAQRCSPALVAELLLAATGADDALRASSGLAGVARLAGLFASSLSPASPASPGDGPPPGP